MTAVSRTIPARIDTVFATLIDPDTYPDWLVGCQDIRAIDDDWPTVGSKFHHKVGLGGPLVVADSTEVLAIEPAVLLSLEVRSRPLGRGRATFKLESTANGEGTELTLDEVPIGALSPLAPVLAPLTQARNRKSLAQLADYIARSR